MDWAAIGTISGIAGLGLAGGQVAVRVDSRPRVTLEADTERIHSRVEADGAAYVRLLAHNGRFRRGARGARIIVQSYRPDGEPSSARVTFGSPSLGWTSGGPEADAAQGALTIPPGVARP